MRRVWLVPAFVVAAALVAWGLFRLVAGDVADQMAGLPKDVEVDVSMHGIELSQGGAGRVQWRLSAKGAQYLQDAGRILVDGPVVTYYGGLGRNATLPGPGEPVVVRASRGEVEQEAEIVSLWPDVVLTSGASTIRAERLVFTGGRTRTIRLTGAVRLTGPGMETQAPEVVLDLSDNVITATGGVEAALAPPGPVANTEVGQ